MNFNSYSSSILSSAAYAEARKVFSEVDASGDNWQDRLASVGIIGAAAVREYAVVYVAQKRGIKPVFSRGVWTFSGVNVAANSAVKYIVAAATGSREVTIAKGKAKKAKKSNAIDHAAKLVADYNKLSGAEKRAFLRAIGK